MTSRATLPPLAERPVRIQRQRTAGWRMPPNTVYVGGSSRWGNPFRAGGVSGVFADAILIKSLSAEQAVEFYETALRGCLRPEMHPRGHIWLQWWRDSRGQTPIEAVRELRGKNLACWCPLDKPCHADVLLELANADPA